MPIIIGKMTNRIYVEEGINTISDLAVTYKKYGVATKLIASLEDIKKQRKDNNDKESANLAEDAIKRINDIKE